MSSGTAYAVFFWALRDAGPLTVFFLLAVRRLPLGGVVAGHGGSVEKGRPGLGHAGLQRIQQAQHVPGLAGRGQPPHYMVPTDDEVFHHFKAINDAADIGIMLYNAPWAVPQPG